MVRDKSSDYKNNGTYGRNQLSLSNNWTNTNYTHNKLKNMLIILLPYVITTQINLIHL